MEYVARVQSHIGHNVTALVDDLISKEIIEVEDLPSRVDENGDPVDVLEWWLVTECLAIELAARGEAVMCQEQYGILVWGRTTAGQAIHHDSVIKDIFESN